MKIFQIMVLAGLGIAIGTQVPNPVRAGEKKKVMEALPPHLAFRVKRRTSNLNPTGLATVPRAVVRRLKLWQPERFPITVCFFGGSVDLRVRIMNAAVEWTRHQAKIPLDFGDAANPRECTSNESDIKIGYNYSGYWSMVGQDSRDLLNAHEQSMNFGIWDVAPAPEPELTQTVLHEFGHALGYEHEHQHPFSKCQKEFDWPAIYKYLAGHPNYWPPEKVDFNMRQLNPEGLAVTEFDSKSIMLYTFEPEFYLKREKSECYAPPNYALSDKDIAFAAEMYPADPAVAAAERDKAVATYTTALSAPSVGSADRLRAVQEIEVLSAPALAGAARRMTIERLQAPSSN